MVPSTPVSRPSLATLWRASHASSAALAGLVGSVPAAVVALLVLMLGDFVAGRPFGTTPLHLGEIIGHESWWGVLVVHFAMSAAAAVLFGVLIAFTAHHVGPTAGAVCGAFYGVAVWLIWFVLVLPLFDRFLAAQIRLGLLWHMAWGATVGFVFHHARVSERRRHRLAPGARPPLAGTSRSPR